MIAFLPTVPGVSANALGVTDAIVPFAGAVLVGLFLSSLAGIVITILADGWLTRRQVTPVTAPAVNTVALFKAA